MINTNFAPNEELDDAILSLSLIFQPWKWKTGTALEQVKKTLLDLLNISPKTTSIFFFLTGRSSLFFLLKSLELPKNTDVLVQAFTCEAVVLPILTHQLNPVYVDIDPQTYSMDIKDLQKKLTKKSKVLILQHTFGIVPDRKNILDFAKKHDLFIIEDLAHGFEEKTFSDDVIATTKLLSFGRSKSVSSVFGGAIITSDQKTAANLKECEATLDYPNSFFIFKLLLYKPLSMLIKSTYDISVGKIIHMLAFKTHLLTHEITSKEKNGTYDTVFNYKFPNGLALLLKHQLGKLAKKQSNRSRAVALYNQKLKNTQSLQGCLIRYPLIVENPSEVVKHGLQYNISFGKWYDQVVAPKDLQLENVRYEMGSCPTAESISSHIINLPTEVSEKEALKIIDILS